MSWPFSLKSMIRSRYIIRDKDCFSAKNMNGCWSPYFRKCKALGVWETKRLRIVWYFNPCKLTWILIHDKREANNWFLCKRRVNKTIWFPHFNKTNKSPFLNSLYNYHFTSGLRELLENQSLSHHQCWQKWKLKLTFYIPNRQAGEGARAVALLPTIASCYSF